MNASRRTLTRPRYIVYRDILLPRYFVVIDDPVAYTDQRPERICSPFPALFLNAFVQDGPASETTRFSFRVQAGGPMVVVVGAPVSSWYMLAQRSGDSLSAGTSWPRDYLRLAGGRHGMVGPPCWGGRWEGSGMDLAHVTGSRDGSRRAGCVFAGFML